MGKTGKSSKARIVMLTVMLAMTLVFVIGADTDLPSCLIHLPDGNCPSLAEAAICRRWGGIEVTPGSGSPVKDTGDLPLASATMAMQVFRMAPVPTGEKDASGNDLYDQIYVVSYYVAAVGTESAFYRVDVWDATKAKKPDLFQDPETEGQAAEVHGGGHVAKYQIFHDKISLPPTADRESIENAGNIKYATLYAQMKGKDGNMIYRCLVYEFCLLTPEGCIVKESSSQGALNCAPG